LGADASDELIEQGEEKLSPDSNALRQSEAIADQNIDSLTSALKEFPGRNDAPDGTADKASVEALRAARTAELQRGLLSAVGEAMDKRGLGDRLRKRLAVSDVRKAAEANGHMVRFTPVGGSEITGIQILDKSSDPKAQTLIAQCKIKSPSPFDGDGVLYLTNEGADSLKRQLENNSQDSDLHQKLYALAMEQTAQDNETIYEFSSEHGGDREGPDGEADKGDPEMPTGRKGEDGPSAGHVMAR
jgi:hypothetical protein